MSYSDPIDVDQLSVHTFSVHDYYIILDAILRYSHDLQQSYAMFYCHDGLYRNINDLMNWVDQEADMEEMCRAATGTRPVPIPDPRAHLPQDTDGLSPIPLEEQNAAQAIMFMGDAPMNDTVDLTEDDVIDLTEEDFEQLLSFTMD